jgi:hypothetical protein
MYKVEVKINEYAFTEEESITIETFDFDKVEIIVKFIEFQQDHGWAVDYAPTAEYLANQDDEDAGVEFGEDEEYVYDEDTDAWYWYDEDADAWYVYDEESDDWVEYVEDEESEEESEEKSEDEATTVTSYVITRIEE